MLKVSLVHAEAFVTRRVLIQIDRLNPDSDGAQKLLKASDEYIASLYPNDIVYVEGQAGLDYMTTTEELKGDNVIFLGAWVITDLVGCAALVITTTTTPAFTARSGELKRVWVHPRARGMGIGKALIQALEDKARQLGVTRLELETGIYQKESIALYLRQGFCERGRFGNYTDNGYSVFMEKVLYSPPPAPASPPLQSPDPILVPPP